MTLAFSNTVRNALLDAIETAIGASAVLKIRTGSPPGIGNADSGSVLATLNLPSDWMDPASGGTKAKAGTWQDASADAAGVAGHFRLYAGTTPHIEGTITVTGGGGDMTVDNTSFAVAQQFTITGFTLAAGN